jgi:hypothetical protein
MQSKKLYESVELVTDTRGAKAFIDAIKLPFTSVRVELDSINIIPSSLWMAGKLKAYTMQDVPFFHQDTDVFLWKKFPDNILNSDIFAQHLETHQNNDNFDNVYPKHLRYMTNTNFTLDKYCTKAAKAYNVGVIGGNNLESIHKYAKSALGNIYNNINKWDDLEKQYNDISYCNAVLEQMALYNFSITDNVRVSTVLPELFSDQDAANMGYTHLMNTKLATEAMDAPLLWERTKQFTQKHYPEYYDNAVRWLADGGFA